MTPTARSEAGGREDRVAGIRMIERLCVYCGSSVGADPVHAEVARALGGALASAGITLVYGGGRAGLMGLVADAALAGGGRVVGIIPDRLRAAELAHPGLSELVVTASLHERKSEMERRSDAFAALPGGIGTLDETIEMLSWRRLGLHDKPIFLVDTGGYWRKLRDLIDHVVAEGFAAPSLASLLRVVPSVADLLAALHASAPGAAPPQAIPGNGG
jgi:uncharacterized protein (TIGR00730 family)